jgi:hypothetical protein
MMHESAEFLDVAATAKRLGVSASYLNKARLSGDDGPPFAKFSTAVRYSWPMVKAWAESRMRRSTSDRGEAG